MKLPKIIKDFSRCSDLALDARAISVYNGMRGNNHFIDAGTPLEQMEVARQQFSIALAAAQSRDTLKVSLKNDAKKKLRSLLNDLAYYVESVARGDRSILLSSGFSVSPEVAAAKGESKTIRNFRIRHGANSGEIKASVTRIRNFNIYSFYFGYMNGDTMVWDSVTGSGANVVIKDLVPGRTYTFYVKIIGSGDQHVISESVTKVVS